MSLSLHLHPPVPYAGYGSYFNYIGWVELVKEAEDVEQYLTQGSFDS